MTCPPPSRWSPTRPPAPPASTDRGRIAEGLRADLVAVRMVGDQPVVQAVWREGRQVY
jgi:alpha-D-ribose 1-methylphosphonate 5-triphosphate diphosphatase